MRAIDRDLIRGGHYGQRPRVPHFKGRTHGCTDQCCKREESPCQLGAVHTWHIADIRGTATFCPLLDKSGHWQGDSTSSSGTTFSDFHFFRFAKTHLARPLYPRKQTFLAAVGTSALCQRKLLVSFDHLGGTIRLAMFELPRRRCETFLGQNLKVHNAHLF